MTVADDAAGWADATPIAGVDRGARCSTVLVTAALEVATALRAVLTAVVLRRREAAATAAALAPLPMPLPPWNRS
jgi:hypothetical protein